jgi:thioredoxin-like negative regulator of GroEL
MEHLENQEMFEMLLGKIPSEKPVPGFAVIWFSAKWCGPCRRVNESILLEMVPEAKWYKCDIDENDYTPGYCGIRSIPNFVAISNQKIVGQLQTSDTLQIIDWVKRLLNSESK